MVKLRTPDGSAVDLISALLLCFHTVFATRHYVCSNVKYAVLDEADQMLQMGFAEEVSMTMITYEGH